MLVTAGRGVFNFEEGYKVIMLEDFRKESFSGRILIKIVICGTN